MQKGSSPYTWVVDPIDGTRSFILGQMHWATLIALNDGERVVAGIAHQPYVGETFFAAASGIAEWRRGRERRTSAHAPLPLASAPRCSPARTRRCSARRGSARRSAASPTGCA